MSPDELLTRDDFWIAHHSFCFPPETLRSAFSLADDAALIDATPFAADLFGLNKDVALIHVGKIRKAGSIEEGSDSKGLVVLEILDPFGQGDRSTARRCRQDPRRRSRSTHREAARS